MGHIYKKISFYFFFFFFCFSFDSFSFPSSLFSTSLSSCLSILDDPGMSYGPTYPTFRRTNSSFTDVAYISKRTKKLGSNFHSTQKPNQKKQPNKQTLSPNMMP